MTKSVVLPSETGGGVLADEMGMGKSLSTLSLITKTLQDAHIWASDWSLPVPNSDFVIKQSSRATLVVVSSLCEYIAPRISPSATAETKASITKFLVVGD